MVTCGALNQLIFFRHPNSRPENTTFLQPLLDITRNVSSLAARSTLWRMLYEVAAASNLGPGTFVLEYCGVAKATTQRRRQMNLIHKGQLRTRQLICGMMWQTAYRQHHASRLASPTAHLCTLKNLHSLNYGYRLFPGFPTLRSATETSPSSSSSEREAPKTQR